MKFDKKLIVFVLAIMLLLSACSPTPATSEEPQGEPSNVEATAETTDDEADDTKQPEETPTEAEETPTEAEETPDEPDVSEDSDLKLQGPFVMTTCGQSSGSVMFHVVASQAGLDSVDEHQLLEREMETVAENAKTLVITTGTSGKGMGAAGTDVNNEIERCTAVAMKAKEMGMTVVCAHIEGMSRRTDSSDQASIDAILPLADIIVCVEDSNSDNYFSDYAEDNDIPIIIVPDSLALSDYLS